MASAQYPLQKIKAILTREPVRARLSCEHIVVVRYRCEKGDQVGCYHCYLDPILDHHAQLAFEFRDDLIDSPYLREAIRTPVLLEEEGR